DLFLLLVFTVAVCRIWSIPIGVVALLAFGLSYHEPGAPRFAWLFLLFPVALLKAVPEGKAKSVITVWKFVAVGLLALILVPFIATQIQSTIYPQLERPGVKYVHGNLFTALSGSTHRFDSVSSRMAGAEAAADTAVREARFKTSNLAYDPQARIQTGPAQPTWSWNVVRCFWNGPVTATQTIRPILISMQMHRLLTIVRVSLLLCLAALIIRPRKISLRPVKTVAAAIVALCMVGQPDQVAADEFPSEQMLKTLRERMLRAPDVFPNAAEIPAVNLVVEDTRVTMTAEVHTATEVAVPMPGELPVWSPVSVTVGNEPAQYVCRKDNFLWVALPKGVHLVKVESLLPDVAEWAWTFHLKPHAVTVTAPGWSVTGIGQNGVPQEQLLFSRQREATEEAAYDQKDFSSILAVDRHLEIGLIWQVRTVVTRLSSNKKAVSLKVPLLPSESVLTPNVEVDNGVVEVSLAAGQEEYSWLSELPRGNDVQLQTRATDTWVERWHLVTSPVWNVSRSGLEPVFESQETALIPVWHPWPGETATLSFSKPQAVSGDTMTVKRVDHTVTLGPRQRETSLELELECSIGSDFRVDISPDAAISSIVHDERPIPVRRDGRSVLIPVRPGQQKIHIRWTSNELLTTSATSGEISLPVEASNSTTVVHVPESRWILWTNGPLRGPAVRFWIILVLAVLIAIVLGSFKISPLRRFEWVLLAIGLTQVHLTAAFVVVAWLFVVARRGSTDVDNIKPWRFNLRQIGIVFLTVIALGVFVVIVGAGLLGNPDMFIVGNRSYRHYLNWFQPRIGTDLPVATVVSISVWYYRLLMLFWALWLAASLIRWLKWGWEQFSHGGTWKRFKPVIIEAAAVAAEPNA
ncbi:MAG: hypothetical protein KDB27_07680, partial [Planctomycetales bacterium]|nr:hypothetical protein [Planctomycetales bacterium]